MNFIDLLSSRARHRDGIALTQGDTSFSYEALFSLAGSVQAFLGSVTRPGERVGLLGANSPFLVAAYIATIGAGRVAVPLNPGWSGPNLVEVLRLCGIEVLFVESRWLARHRDLTTVPRICVEERDACRDGLLPASTDIGAIQRDFSGAPFAPVADTPELAVINFTSGTSGRPRGVMVSHGNLIANTESILEYLGLRGDDCGMLTLPIFYCYGASVLHTHLAAGARLCLNNRFMFVEKFLDDLDAQKCTGFSGVPAHFHALLRRSSFLRRNLRSLRYLTCAGGQLATAYVEELRKAKPSVELFLMYGQTEATSRLSYLPPALVDLKPRSIGKGMAGVTLKVVHGDGTPVREGEMGEIVAQGENVTLGYWKDPEATARRFRGGWLHTGDIATVDREGYIYITGRAEDFLKSVGHRVSPTEIEEVITRMPEVAECVVVPANDPELGECLGAYVVPQEGRAVTADAVIRFCRPLLPTYKVPARVAITSDLPKSETGKVLRRHLAPL